MTFMLKDQIICVGKFSVEKQSLSTKKFNNDSVDSKIFIIKPDGNFTKIADLKVGGYEMIESAVKKRWNYVDLKSFQI